MTAARDRDNPRDAHLLAALRHAPDRDLAPPAALSAQILDQARQAIRPSRSPTPDAAGGVFERWFGWMSRPLAAGALGTVLIAAFVGLMWRGGPPLEALPGADPPQLAERAEPAAAPAAATQTPAAATQPGAAPAPAAVPPPPVRKSVQRQSADSGAATAQGTTAPVLASPPLPASPAPLPAVRSAAPPAVASPQPAPAPAAAALRPEAAAAEVGANMARSSRPLDSASATARPTAPELDPLAPVLAALNPAADPAWRERLLGLQRQAQGRWVSVDEPTLGAAAAAARSEPVVDASGRLLGRLRIDGNQLLWQGTDGRSWRATLSANVPPPERAASN